MPHQAAAHAESDGRDLHARRPALQFVDAGLQVGDEVLRRDLAQRRGGLGGIGERRRAALAPTAGRWPAPSSRCPANRPATERAQSVRPLFSWMTSTAPFGRRRRGPGALQFAAAGPAQVIGFGRQRRVSIPGGGALSVAAPLDVTGASAVGVRVARLLVLAARGDQRGRRRGADTDQREPCAGPRVGTSARRRGRWRSLRRCSAAVESPIASMPADCRSRVADASDGAILDVMVTRTPARRPARARRRGRRSDPRCGSRHRRRTRRGGCHGRVHRPQPARPATLRSDYDRPETIEETAQLVTELGGVGVAIPIDHLDVDAGARAGRPDPRRLRRASTSSSTTSGAPRFSRGHRRRGTGRSGSTTSTTVCGSCGSGVDTHLITSHCLLPLLVDTAGWTARRGDRRHGRVQRASTTGCRCSTTWPRSSVNRLAFSQGHDLAPFGVHGGRGHAGLAALGDDARQLRVSPRRTGGRAWTRTAADGYPSRRRRSPNRRRRGSSAAALPRSPPTRIARGGISGR